MALVMIGITFVTFFALVYGSPETSWGEEFVDAPDFTLPTIQGKSVSLDEYRGKVVLLNFWATWCKDCVLEMPELETLFHKFQGKGLTIFAIALDKEGQPAVDHFLKKENLELTYPILLDPEGRVARAYRLSWVPVTIVVGRGGKIIETILGARPWGSKEVMEKFQKLLKDSKDN